MLSIRFYNTIILTYIFKYSSRQPFKVKRAFFLKAELKIKIVFPFRLYLSRRKKTPFFSSLLRSCTVFQGFKFFLQAEWMTKFQGLKVLILRDKVQKTAHKLQGKSLNFLPRNTFIVLPAASGVPQQLLSCLLPIGSHLSPESRQTLFGLTYLCRVLAGQLLFRTPCWKYMVKAEFSKEPMLFTPATQSMPHHTICVSTQFYCEGLEQGLPFEIFFKGESLFQSNLCHMLVVEHTFENRALY